MHFKENVDSMNVLHDVVVVVAPYITGMSRREISLESEADKELCKNDAGTLAKYTIFDLRRVGRVNVYVPL